MPQTGVQIIHLLVPQIRIFSRWGVSASPDVMVTPDTLFFQTMSDLTEGKTAHVRNYTLQTVPINYINSSSISPFAWHIDPWSITLPYTVVSGDSLNLTVKFDLPAMATDQLCDSLIILTQVSTHQVAICVNPGLLTQISELKSIRNNVTLYPNPVSNIARFEYELNRKADVRLDVMSLNGSVVQTLVNEVQDRGHPFIYVAAPGYQWKSLACRHVFLQDVDRAGCLFGENFNNT